MQELFYLAALFVGALVAFAVVAEVIRLSFTKEEKEAPVEVKTKAKIKARVRGKIKLKDEVSSLTPFGTSTRYAHALSACKYDLGDARAAGDPSKKAYKKAFAKAARQEARRYEKQYR